MNACSRPFKACFFLAFLVLQAAKNKTGGVGADHENKRTEKGRIP